MMEMAMDERKAQARRDFQNHKAEVVTDTDRILAIDWRHQDGRGNYYVNYIIDKERGALIVSGDLGSSVACWYNPIEPSKLAGLVRDPYYYLWKLAATSDKWEYTWESIKADVFELRQGYLEESSFDEDEVKEDFDRVLDILDEIDVNEYTVYPEELEAIFEKYDADWYQNSDFTCIGRRLSQRVVLWAVGLQMALAQIEEGRKNNESNDSDARRV